MNTKLKIECKLRIIVSHFQIGIMKVDSYIHAYLDNSFLAGISAARSGV